VAAQLLGRGRLLGVDDPGLGGRVARCDDGLGDGRRRQESAWAEPRRGRRPARRLPACSFSSPVATGGASTASVVVSPSLGARQAWGVRWSLMSAPHRAGQAIPTVTSAGNAHLFGLASLAPFARARRRYHRKPTIASTDPRRPCRVDDLVGSAATRKSRGPVCRPRTKSSTFEYGPGYGGPVSQ
jgi:hypothetical protein